MSSKQKIRIPAGTPSRLKKTFWERFGLPIKAMMLVLAVVVLFGGIYAVTQIGPKSRKGEDFSNVQIESPEVAEKRAEVNNMVITFDGIAATREPSRDDLKILSDAIDIQIQVVRLNQAGNLTDVRRLEDLQNRYDTLQGAFMYEESVSEENLGEAALLAEDREKALQHFSRAHNLQLAIHEDYIESDFVSHRRLVGLKRRMDEIELGPRYEESVRLAQYAEQSIKVQDWDAARDFLDRALGIQKDINLNFPASKYKNVTRYSQLETLRSTVASGNLYDEVNELREVAEQLLEDGEYRKAAAKFQEAAVRQGQLNSIYDLSRFASEDELREIDVRRQSALSAKLADDIVATNEALTTALRDRRAFEAVKQAAELQQQLERMKENFPDSDRYREDLMLKASFLSLRESDIGFIQDRFFDQLIALEDIPGLLMLKTEMSQVLYERIMGTNPSRNRQPLFPVDSVTWNEANEFCERLGWMLGRPVLLPSREEIEIAIGDIRYAPLAEITWNNRNTNRETVATATSQANREGFFDLLGNVSEWTRDQDGSFSDRAFVMGGNVSDSVEKLASIPSNPRPIRERNRFTGFRVVVQMDGYEASTE